MKTHTTATDLRRIMKLHGDGLSAKQIAAEVFIDEKKVASVIKSRAIADKKGKK